MSTSNEVTERAQASSSPRKAFLTFLHLSDIHFSYRQGSAQFDLEAQLRMPLLNDINSKPADGAAYDGMLITGDIAFSGKKSEYEKAKHFLEQIYQNSESLPGRTFMIPGNHDVDRSLVIPDGAIWNNHARLRNTPDKILRRNLLQTQLTRDPACNPLAPLESYNEFAQGYGCRSEKDKLAWVEIFPILLNDGSQLRISGLNSALNSDEGDEVGKLYVAPFQTQHYSLESGIVDLLLCHHPPHWLLDKIEVEAILNSFIRLALFGHEHNHRMQRIENTVHLYAGAVYPAARDPDWLPTYHILQLRVDGAGKNRKLVVRIYSRELRALGYTFVPRMAQDGRIFEERTVDLPEWYPPSEACQGQEGEIKVCSERETRMPDDTRNDSSVRTVALRELLVHFHRLSTPLRYRIATDLNLLRDGDDLPPQQQWDLVFKRAKDEDRLSDLWQAVASKDSVFAKLPNPFSS